MTETAIQQLTDADFQQKLQASPSPAVVDFWAPWCGPCQSLGRELETIAAEFAGQVRILKLNVDENPETAGRFGIRSIPTLVFFEGGEPIGATTGALPRSALRDLFQRHASSSLGKPDPENRRGSEAF